jgi:hypothetical protein
MDFIENITERDTFDSSNKRILLCETERKHSSKHREQKNIRHVDLA